MNISLAGVAEKNGKYLVAKRKPGTSIGEKWEFPGGKKEENESPEEALCREYLEELSVEIKIKGKLCEGFFSNGKKKYKLIAYKIELLSEDFVNTEHQKIEWVELAKLENMDFPESDKIIIDYLLSQ